MSQVESAAGFAKIGIHIPAVNMPSGAPTKTQLSRSRVRTSEGEPERLGQDGAHTLRHQHAVLCHQPTQGWGLAGTCFVHV